MEIPVQYFQSIITVQLAIAGALLWQIRFFDSDLRDKERDASLPDPRLRLLMALLITANLFGALEAMREGGGRITAILLTVGLAVSLLPILLRTLPPLGRDAATMKRDPHYWVTVAGLVLFTAVVALIVSIP
ncbi:hypothetical protein [Leifsonia sp. NPDC058248]|uniref:hypothetical protein n=1 Tax=Leifsonia sp. NPDC058248 TaxID=3346402 RepID=UPI0036D98C50